MCVRVRACVARLRWESLVNKFIGQLLPDVMNHSSRWMAAHTFLSSDSPRLRFSSLPLLLSFPLYLSLRRLPSVHVRARLF